jgi:hypothetical protein
LKSTYILPRDIDLVLLDHRDPIKESTTQNDLTEICQGIYIDRAIAATRDACLKITGM